MIIPKVEGSHLSYADYTLQELQALASGLSPEEACLARAALEGSGIH